MPTVPLQPPANSHLTIAYVNLIVSKTQSMGRQRHPVMLFFSSHKQKHLAATLGVVDVALAR